VKVLLPSDRSAASLHAARLLAEYRGERSRIEPVLLNVQRPVLKAWPGTGLDRAAVEAAMRRHLHPDQLKVTIGVPRGDGAEATDTED